MAAADEWNQQALREVARKEEESPEGMRMRQMDKLLEAEVALHHQKFPEIHAMPKKESNQFLREVRRERSQHRTQIRQEEKQFNQALGAERARRQRIRDKKRKDQEKQAAKAPGEHVRKCLQEAKREKKESKRQLEQECQLNRRHQCCQIL